MATSWPRTAPKTHAEQQFCGLGADSEAFLVGVAAIGNTRLGSELEVLLGLGAAYGSDALVAAAPGGGIHTVPRRRPCPHGHTTTDGGATS
jgi:hypothetical protein